jgi:LacI family transcriptional regulator
MNVQKPPGKSKPTIRDVARRARVAVGTVSHVLNQTTKVSDAKRERVLKAIADLGYTQNMLAQGLRSRTSNVVGLCVPFTSISYFGALVDVFEEVASNRGYEIMQVLSRQDPQKELKRVKSLLNYHVGGIMMLPSVQPAASFDVIAASGTPLVVIDRPTTDKRFDQVTYDNYGAMFEACSHLIAVGHRRILMLVRQRQLSVTIDRVNGLNGAVRESGKDVEARVVECSYDETLFMARIGPELASDQRPTAIIVSNSTLAIWTLRAFAAMNISCPADISLLAIDEPEWADLVHPSLSLIRPPTRTMAFTAWELLLQRMTQGADEPQHVEFKAEIVLRHSVGPPGGKRAAGARTKARVPQPAPRS